MNESSLAIEAAFQEDAVKVGVEADKVSRRGVGDQRGTLDSPAGTLVEEALDHAVDESTDLTEEVAVVAEEDAQQLGECEDHLPVGEAKQEPLVHVLAEKQCAFLGAGRTQMEDLAAEGSEVIRFAFRIGAPDPRDAVRAIAAPPEALDGPGDAVSSERARPRGGLALAAFEQFGDMRAERPQRPAGTPPGACVTIDQSMQPAVHGRAAATLRLGPSQGFGICPRCEPCPPSEHVIRGIDRAAIREASPEDLERENEIASGRGQNAADAAPGAVRARSAGRP